MSYLGYGDAQTPTGIRKILYLNWPLVFLIAAVAGTAMFGVAAEMAAGRTEVRGPGTYVPAFLDELYAIRKATVEGDMRWLTMVKIRGVYTAPP